MKEFASDHLEVKEILEHLEDVPINLRKTKHTLNTWFYTEPKAIYIFLKSETDKEFFFFSNEVATLHKVQNEFSEDQNVNWELIQKQNDVFNRNIRLL